MPRLRRLKTRAWLVTLALLLVIDCFLNMCCRGSFRQTLSGEAWRQRNHPRYGRFHRWIDVVFAKLGQVNHCEQAHDAETRHGNSIWGSWSCEWRRTFTPRPCFHQRT